MLLLFGTLCTNRYSLRFASFIIKEYNSSFLRFLVGGCCSLSVLLPCIYPLGTSFQLSVDIFRSADLTHDPRVVNLSADVWGRKEYPKARTVSKTQEIQQEIRSFYSRAKGNQVIMRSFGEGRQVLILFDWCTYKKENLDTDAHRGKMLQRKLKREEESYTNQAQGLEQILPSQPLKGTNSADLGLLTSRTMTVNFRSKTSISNDVFQGSQMITVLWE